MKIRILTLIMGIAICAASPVCAMETEVIKEDFDQRVARLKKESSERRRRENEHGSNTAQTAKYNYVMWDNECYLNFFKLLADYGYCESKAFLYIADQEEAKKIFNTLDVNSKAQERISYNIFNFPIMKKNMVRYRILKLVGNPGSRCSDGEFGLDVYTEPM